MPPITSPADGALRRDLAIVAAATLVLLIPFAGKAIHIDDPLFLWSAKQIRAHPLDPFGFDVNWYGITKPMADVTKNPPGAAYYIAAASFVTGWNETALHIAFLPWAVAAALGVYLLSRRFCARPLEATLAALCTPAFLVSATTLMCDVPMLACWMWGAVLWMRGIERRHAGLLVGAALLAALAAFMKYFGIALIPLLVVWTIAERRRFDPALLVLLLPVGILALYQWWTVAIYRHGMITEAAAYASEIVGRSTAAKALVALAFAGGSFASLLAFAPRLVRGMRRVWVWAAVVVAAAAGSFITALPRVPQEAGSGAAVALELPILIAAGAAVAAIAVAALRHRRDAGSLFLLLWIAGTLLFTAFVNWSINVRSILPLVPAAAIVLVRRLDRQPSAAAGPQPGTPIVTPDPPSAGPTLLSVRRPAFPGISSASFAPLLVSVAIALAVAWADYSFAGAVRDDVEAIWAHPRDPRASLWYEGHWGFQYYMDLHGGKAIDFGNSRLPAGDIFIIPRENTNGFIFPSEYTIHADSLVHPSAGWIATMSHDAGAGFYADVWGPAPFVIGPIPPERYDVYVLRQPVGFK